MKLIRFIILFKAAKVELDKIFHPGSVKAVSINGKKISNDIVFKTSLFFFIYFAIFFVSLLLISIDNKDIVSSATAVIASLSNVGRDSVLSVPQETMPHFPLFQRLFFRFA